MFLGIQIDVVHHAPAAAAMHWEVFMCFYSAYMLLHAYGDG